MADGSRDLQEFLQDQAVLSHIGGAIEELSPQIERELKTTGDSHAVVELTVSNEGDMRSIVHKEVVSEGRTAVEALRFAVGAPRDKLSKPETNFYYVSVTRDSDGTQRWAIETYSTEFVQGAKANYHDEILNYRKSKGPMGPGIIYLPGTAPKEKPGASAASGPANPFHIPNYNDPADTGTGGPEHQPDAPVHVEVLGNGADPSQPDEGDGPNNVLLESHTYELNPGAPPVMVNKEFGWQEHTPLNMPNGGGGDGDEVLDFDDFND
ncbi:hypothetical protein [Rhizobium ruizarguesonis]|uniref:hypothetical protein n=1 Tax=Rhizobium ruizarguesonis TaxID=2081791 RepID=UPI001030235A|nr:hypothetical protein [Rhizobium ruizarguesonis]TBA16123.1 hypothetical protein ELH65_09145 [Rhizobium ruizarguesonis]